MDIENIELALPIKYTREGLEIFKFLENGKNRYDCSIAEIKRN